MLPNDKSFLLQQIEDGKIDVANRYLKINCNDSLEPSEALSLLIRLCNYVFKKQSCKTAIEDIYYLTDNCCKHMKILSNASDKYLASLFHIQKYFFEQVKVVQVSDVPNVRRYISNITDHILSYFKENKTVIDLYKSLISLYYKEVVQSAKNQTLNDWEIIAVKSLALYKYGTTDQYKTFFVRFDTYCSMLMQKNVTNQQRKSYCMAMLQLLQDVIVSSEDVCEGSYKAMLNLINTISFNAYRASDEEITGISDLVDSICQTMKNMYMKPRYISCTIIVQNLFRSFLKRMGARSEKDCILLNNCVQNLNDLKDSDSNCAILNRTCCTLQRLLKLYIAEYFQKRIDLWAEEFEPNILAALFALLELMGHIIQHTEPVNAYGSFLLSVHFMETNLKLNLPFPEELHILNLRCLEKCFKIMVRLMENGRQQFESQWKYVASVVYNSAVTLYSNRGYDLVKSYYFLLAKYIILIDGVESSTCFENALATTLHLYAGCLTYSADYKRAMTFIALLLLLEPSFAEKALHLLVFIKSYKNNEYLKELTTRDLLEKGAAVIRELYPGYQYDATVIGPLLVAELEYYYRKWPSKVPIQNACRDIFAVSADTQLLTKAFYFSCRKVSVLYEQHYLETLRSTIGVIENSDGKHDAVNVVCLAVLYYALYQAKSSELFEKVAEDMNEVAIPLQSSTQPDENESLDIVATYQNLNIQTKLEQLNYLIKSLDLCDQVLLFQPVPLHEISDFCVMNIIRMIALEFRVQHFQFHMLRAWYLHLDYCKIFKHQQGILESVGFILEHSHGFPDKDLEPVAENALKVLEEKKGVGTLENGFRYSLNKCYGMLRSGQTKKACEVFNEVENKLREAGVDMPLVTAQLLHLKAIFLLSSCNEQLLCHKELYLVAAHDSFATLADVYRTRPSTDPYILSLLLDSAATVGWIYKWIRFPREVRCYTKDVIKLTQKLLLPIRTAQFMSLLAYTDLLDRQFNDCEVKLDGLTRILNYRSDVTLRAPVQQRTKPENHLIGEKPNCNLLPVRFLDVPHTRYKNITGSPELNRKPFTMPKIFSDAEDCVCLTCTNFEYQKLLFELVHLEAILCYYTRGGCDRVEEYFDGGFLLEQTLSTKYSVYLDSCKNILYKKIYTALWKPLQFSYCVFLLDNSYFLAQKGYYPQAIRVIDQLKRYHWLKYTNIIFTNEIRCQEIVLRYASAHKPAPKKSPKLTLSTSYETVVTKTPDNKIVATKVKLSVSPVPDLQPKKAMKAVKLDFSDSDTEDVKATPKPSKNCKPQTAATPAFKAPEIKVTKVPLKEIRTSSTVPPMPATDRAKTRAHQQQRMKILTEKLKAENNSLATSATKRPATRSTIAAQKENATPANSVQEISAQVEKMALEPKKPTKCFCSQARPATRPKRTGNTSTQC